MAKNLSGSSTLEGKVTRESGNDGLLFFFEEENEWWEMIVSDCDGDDAKNVFQISPGKKCDRRSGRITCISAFQSVRKVLTVE